MTYRQILIYQERGMVEMLRCRWIGFYWSDRSHFHAALHDLRRIVQTTL